MVVTNANLRCAHFDTPFSDINTNFVQHFLSCDLGVHCPTASIINDMLLVKSKQDEISTLCDD